jgi:hypothetical protein
MKGFHSGYRAKSAMTGHTRSGGASIAICVSIV